MYAVRLETSWIFGMWRDQMEAEAFIKEIEDLKIDLRKSKVPIYSIIRTKIVDLLVKHSDIATRASIYNNHDWFIKDEKSMLAVAEFEVHSPLPGT